MIYQCIICKKLFDENDGAMVIEYEEHAGFPATVSNTILVFKCKSCISDKGRKIIERIQREGNEK